MKLILGEAWKEEEEHMKTLDIVTEEFGKAISNLPGFTEMPGKKLEYKHKKTGYIVKISAWETKRQ